MGKRCRAVSRGIKRGCKASLGAPCLTALVCPRRPNHPGLPTCLSTHPSTCSSPHIRVRRRLPGCTRCGTPTSSRSMASAGTSKTAPAASSQNSAQASANATPSRNTSCTVACCLRQVHWWSAGPRSLSLRSVPSVRPCLPNSSALCGCEPPCCPFVATSRHAAFLLCTPCRAGPAERAAAAIGPLGGARVWLVAQRAAHRSRGGQGAGVPASTGGLSSRAGTRQLA